MVHKYNSPEDFGSADRYYGRDAEPRYMRLRNDRWEFVREVDMTPEQVAEYKQGFYEEEDRKDWGDHQFAGG